jgi:multisubunit Na+/H+ antiporter MnhF subunit
MQRNLLPAAGIIIVTIILIAINEFTDTTIVRDYALIFIILGMLFGVWLTKMADRQ